MSYAEIARRAAEIMSERGHCKHTMEDREGRVCFAGAIGFAVDGRIVWSRKVQSIFRPLEFAGITILQERGWRPETGRTDPVSFNNDPRVTGEDVILLLKEIAERVEKWQTDGRFGT